MRNHTFIQTSSRANRTFLSRQSNRLQAETAVELDALLPALLDLACKGEHEYACQ